MSNGIHFDSSPWENKTRPTQGLHSRSYGFGTVLLKRANPAQLALRAMQGITLRDLPPVDALAGQKDWGLLRWRYRLVPRR